MTVDSGCLASAMSSENMKAAHRCAAFIAMTWDQRVVTSRMIPVASATSW